MSTPVAKQVPPTEDYLPAAHPQQQRISAALGIVLVSFVMLGIGAGVWRLFFYRSPINKGLQALQKAYSTARPLEVRLSGFAYAPLANTRGASAADNSAHTVAERLLFEAVDDNQSHESHQALGLYYLTERQYDRAIDEFKTALQTEAQNARLHSDLGAALFEKGRGNAESDEDGKNVEAFAESLGHLNRALALDPDFHEAIFNRALLCQHMMLTGYAANEWRAYLEKDSNSPWAVEARQRLSRLEAGQHQIEQNQGSLVEDFLNHFCARDAERMWGLFAPNREKLTTELVVAYLKNAAQPTENSCREALDALTYVGELDAQRVGDHYTTRLADFYRSASRQQLDVARQALELMRVAKAHYNEPKLEQAVAAYESAQRLFTQIGDICGAQQAAFWLGLCYWEMTQTIRSQELWVALAKDCQANEHRWLQARTLNMLSGVAFKGDEYSRAIAYSNEARKLASQVDDVSCVFSADSALIEYYRLLGNQAKCLAQVGRGLPMLGNGAIGMIPLWRYYDIVATAHNTFGLYDAAIDYEREALRFAISADDYARLAVSHANLGLMYGKRQDFDSAFQHAEQAYEIAAAHASEAQGQLLMALASVQMGHLHRERGEFTQALSRYDQAVELHRSGKLDFSAHLYQAYKGRLVCHMALKETEAAQQQFALLLDVMDKHRARIIEEENRDNFFAVEQSVYDLGIDLAYSQNKDSDQAFAYAEASRARSLLDSVSAGAQLIKHDGKLDLQLQAVARPLPLAEIRSRIPNEARLLYYAVLDDKLLIWAVSRAEAHPVEVKVSQAALNEAVTQYRTAMAGLSDEDREATARLARELYGYLIAPVESLLGGSNSLYIVPDKMLNRLPWDALVSPEGRYVVQDYRVTLTPSATLFALCTDIATQKAGTQVERGVVVGNPSFDRKAFPELPPLSDAADEAKEIARLYPPRSLLLGPAARKQAVCDELAKADVAHFALHCVVNERSAMRSALVLAKEPTSGASPQSSDSSLQAYEIYNMKLPRTRMAVLSACESGVERYYRGEGMIGMARAFLVARVPLVVASLWAVDSPATMELMIRFHEYRKRYKLPTDEALCRAKRDLLDGPVERYRQPAYWAAFQAIGGHANF